MPVASRKLKDLIEGTAGHHASLTFPDLQEVTIRWRGSFGYMTAWADADDAPDEDDEPIPLCRIEYLSDDDHWGFALYDPATETLQPGPADNRRIHGAPQRRLRHRSHRPPRRLPAVTTNRRSTPPRTCERSH
jgi:hypothetical protein